MAKITRIKAKDDASDKSAKPKAKSAVRKTTEKRAEKKPQSVVKKAAGVEKKPWPKVLKPLYWLLTPFRALGRYVHEAFVEVRQVRWPNRKTTWKMTFSVILYVVIFAGAIMLLDALLTLIFNNLINR